MEKRPKILSIDDNPTDQKLLQKALEHDYDVTTVLSGCSGIELLCHETPDAIILDVSMPTMDGLKMCRMIRAEPSFRETPILFLSGLDSVNDKLEAFRAGGNDYICKPVNIEQLKEKLRTSLMRQSVVAPDPMVASNEVPALNQNLEILHEYLLQLLRIQQADKLGNVLLTTLNRLNLRGAVCFHHTGKILSSIGPLTDLEALLLRQATLPYPTEYSARFIWGDQYMAAIIQNMPLAKSENYQPLVEILATAFKASNEKLSLLAQRTTDERLDDLQPRKSPPSRPAPSRQPTTGAYSRPRPRDTTAFESIMSQIEQSNDDCLAQVCLYLQKWMHQEERDEKERKVMRKLFNQCTRTQTTIYSQCQDALAILNKSPQHHRVENESV